MDESTRAYLESLKRAPEFGGYRIAIPGSDAFAKVQFVMRGEQAFYQEGDRALLVDVLVGPAVIGARSIKRWDSGEKVTPHEREAIVERISDALRRAGATVIRVER